MDSSLIFDCVFTIISIAISAGMFGVCIWMVYKLLSKLSK